MTTTIHGMDFCDRCVLILFFSINGFANVAALVAYIHYKIPINSDPKLEKWKTVAVVSDTDLD